MVLSNGDFEEVMGGCKAEQDFVRNKGMHDMPLLRTWVFLFLPRTLTELIQEESVLHMDIGAFHTE
jgi:hypothetical protein